MISTFLRVSPDLEWHAACLKCAECSQYLDETCTCFVREGKTYCKRDYTVRIKCAKCELGFSGTTLVMRARDSVYHIECFRCSACGRQLLPGDEYSVREDALLCRGEHGASSPLSPRTCPQQSAAHGRPSTGVTCSSPRRRRLAVRTVLNEKQLHTLRTCYNANPRPGRANEEQLVEMTGLSPRVIRVWFQNKRCKDKKRSILMKQLQQQHGDKTVSIRAYARAETCPRADFTHRADANQVVCASVLVPVLRRCSTPRLVWRTWQFRLHGSALGRLNLKRLTD
ncbi:hypothetical protein SRHO_G00165210 [Serrasalmus rhombeus]